MHLPAETVQELPTIQTNGLKGGVRYYDGQFDDARLALSLAQTMHQLGGFPANYVSAVQLIKRGGRIVGVVARDLETGAEFEIQARVVINATGVFTDFVRQLDDPRAGNLISVSQGAHIVLDRTFLPGVSALMVPKTKDGRVLFVIPWHGRVVVGTTDTPCFGDRRRTSAAAGRNRISARAYRRIPHKGTSGNGHHQLFCGA